MEVVVTFQTLGDLYYVKCLISSCILWCHVSMYAVRLLAWTCPFYSDFVFFFFAFFPLFAIFSVNDEPSWIENGLLQLLLGNNGEGKKENNEGRKRKPQVMIKQFIKYFSAPPNKKHTNFSLFFQVNTKINFSPSLQPPKYKILNTNTKYKSYLPLWQPTDPLLAVFPSPAPDHQTHIKQVTDKIRQMQIKIWQMQIKIWQIQIKIRQM